MVMNQADAISAKEGNVFVTIDNQTFELAELIEVDAKIELETADVTAVGMRMAGAKVVGAKGTGKVKFYYHRPEIRDMVVGYLKKGILPEISIKGTNADIASRAGRQTVVLKGVVFKSATILSLNGSSNDLLTDETDFIFNDVDITEGFKAIK